MNESVLLSTSARCCPAEVHSDDRDAMTTFRAVTYVTSKARYLEHGGRVGTWWFQKGVALVRGWLGEPFGWKFLFHRARFGFVPHDVGHGTHDDRRTDCDRERDRFG